MFEKMIYLAQNCNLSRQSESVAKILTNHFSAVYPEVCFVNPIIMFGFIDNDGKYINRSRMLLDMCDEMWIVGKNTDCVENEIKYCSKYKIPIRKI